jgi:pimeloyl-ACP methyl ester carboxylesterase
MVATLVACPGADDVAPSPNAGASRAPSGGLVDIGGYELAYTCAGEGSPTIVTEAGYDSPGTTTWFALTDELAAISRVCSYDRAGTGTSDPRPDPEGLTSADQANELHALLEEADIRGPYVLVAHSYGGFVSRLFADAYPEDTVGLVLVESSHEDEIEAYEEFYGRGDPRSDWIDGGDLLDIDATGTALRAARGYGEMPLIVVRAERYDDVLDEGLWRSTQAELATFSDDSLLVIASGSGHFVMEPPPGGNPDVLVAAVAAVVEAARSGVPLPTCDAFVAALDAACP